MIRITKKSSDSHFQSQQQKGTQTSNLFHSKLSIIHHLNKKERKDDSEKQERVTSKKKRRFTLRTPKRKKQE